MGSYQNTAVENINQVFETREAQSQAQTLGYPYIDLTQFPINPDVLQIMPEVKARASGSVCFYKKGLHIKIATLDPENKTLTQWIKKKEQDRFEVEIFITSTSCLEIAFGLYAQSLLNKKEVLLNHEFDEARSQNIESEFIRFGDLEEKMQKMTAQQGLNEIEILALQLKASDIHLQPNGSKCTLRFRLDGLLHDICTIGQDLASKIINHIKYEAGMKSNITKVPQDGNLRFQANDRKVDLRISTLPTETIESVVMRVLDTEKGIKSFTDLGFPEETQAQVEKMLRRKNGVILVTGPTGSGKTTTLYSMLSTLNTSEKKIVTLEDPIEYHLDGITQSEVNEKSDYNFSTGLRSLLRHDPDAILIGEIRDLSTAKLASEASLTGHIVFSSLHTNSSIGAITRLRNLGLESYNTASCLNGVLAQRLARKVCKNCAIPHKVQTQDYQKFQEAYDHILKAFPDQKKSLESIFNTETKRLKTFEAKGCEKCAHTGYLGQTVLCELFIPDQDTKRLIAEEASELQIAQAHQKNHPEFLTIFENGVQKILQGDTTLEEVYRVAG